MHKGSLDRNATNPLQRAAMALAVALAGVAGTAAAARVSMDGWSVQLPPGCQAQWQRVAANPLYDAQARKDFAADPMLSLKPDFTNMPAHLSLDLSRCFPGGNGFGSALRVIPLQPYLDIYDSRDGEASKWTRETLAQLQQWIAKGAESMQDWPFLPAVDAHAQHSTARRSLRFDHGKGIRVVAQIVVENGPAYRDQFDYLFQGLSDDGKTYVLLTVPLQIDGLATDKDSEHLGFKVERIYADNSTFERYSEAVSALFRSGAARPQPAPERLDELLTSLRRVEKAAER